MGIFYQGLYLPVCSVYVFVFEVFLFLEIFLFLNAVLFFFPFFFPKAYWRIVKNCLLNFSVRITLSVWSFLFETFWVLTLILQLVAKKGEINLRPEAEVQEALVNKKNFKKRVQKIDLCSSKAFPSLIGQGMSMDCKGSMGLLQPFQKEDFLCYDLGGKLAEKCLLYPVRDGGEGRNQAVTSRWMGRQLTDWYTIQEPVLRHIFGHAM